MVGSIFINITNYTSDLGSCIFIHTFLFSQISFVWYYITSVIRLYDTNKLLYKATRTFVPFLSGSSYLKPVFLEI